MLIRKLVLQTCYLQTLKEFYSSVLELPVDWLSETGLSITIGHTDLIFREADESEPFYHFAINIPSNKIEEARIWMGAKAKLLWIKDYDSEVADFVNWHAKSIYFLDPAGNILELIARAHRKNEGTESFSSRQFLSIDEIGIVFSREEFEKRTGDLLHNYSLSYFEKQPPLPQFRAIGDEEGLLIAVPQHRNWYPTDIAAGIFPTRIEFVNGEKFFGIDLP